MSEGDKLIGIRLLVEGRVQGVGFREACRRKATAEGVAGTARNLRDGTVEVVFEGDASAVRRLVLWCHDGPPMADVVRVVEETTRPSGLSVFEVH